jgi:hypothetical protein
MSANLQTIRGNVKFPVCNFFSGNDTDVCKSHSPWAVFGKPGSLPAFALSS